MAAGESQDMWTTMRRARLIRVLVIYIGASFAALEGIDILTQQAGLPDWVVPGALVLLLIGLPVVIATALVQSASPTPPQEPASQSADPSEAASLAAEPATSAAEVAAGAKHWLTWRRAVLGGVVAFALLGVTTTGYMVMRVMGIGPVGSLVAAGVIDPSERILLADFDNNTSDSLLAVVVTEAFRIDLSQSRLVNLVQPGQVGQALGRMQRPSGTLLDAELAREVAVREGLKAVITGEIGTIGETYVLSAQLVSAESADVFAAFRETADGTGEIIRAVDRLSKKLRERIGESLRSIRANEPLDRVTTGSLEALQKYSQAIRAIDVEGNDIKAIGLLEEAVALDTAFAMAWRKLGVVLSNIGQQPRRAFDALTQAVQHSDRLTDRERYMTLGTYYGHTDEREKAVTAYSTLLDLYPDDRGALVNLGLIYGRMGDLARYEELEARAFEVDSTDAIALGNLVFAQVDLGKLDEAEARLESFAARVPGHPLVAVMRTSMASMRGDYESAEAHTRALRDALGGNPYWRANTSATLASLAQVRGRLAEAEGHIRDVMQASEGRGLSAEYIDAAIDLANLDSRFRGASDQALRTVQEALERYPLDSLAPLDRPYVSLGFFYALADRPDLARAALADHDAAVDPELRRPAEVFRNFAMSIIEVAEERYDDAIDRLRTADTWGCDFCGLGVMATAYDRAGVADSAIAYYEAYIETPWLFRLDFDDNTLPFAYERLGALYEERGDAEKAIYNYGKLAELWDGADAELQPRVEAARRAIQALSSDR